MSVFDSRRIGIMHIWEAPANTGLQKSIDNSSRQHIRLPLLKQNKNKLIYADAIIDWQLTSDWPLSTDHWPDTQSVEQDAVLTHSRRLVWYIGLAADWTAVVAAAAAAAPAAAAIDPFTLDEANCTSTEDTGTQGMCPHVFHYSFPSSSSSCRESS